MAAAPAVQPLIQASLLGDAVEHLPVPVFVFDDAGRYVAMNAQACRTLGYEREELLRMRIGELAAGDRRASLRHYLDVVRGTVPEGTARARRKDGTEVVLRFRARETRVAGMSFYVAICWD